ncbi:MAG: prenyltransferase/squalene oxidase repeat-containing protein [Planctomycetota bacterium]
MLLAITLRLTLSLCLGGPASTLEVPEDLGPSVERAVRILLERQESDEHLELGIDEPVPDDQELAARREWPYQGVYRVRGSIPWGYRVGGTALACLALVEAPGHADDAEAVAAVGRGLEFVLEALDQQRMASGFDAGYDVRGWGHTYALAFLLRLRAANAVEKELAQPVDERIVWLIRALEETQLAQGGWNYARRAGEQSAASPFMTAPTLLALFEAKAQGFAVEDRVVERALDALAASRGNDGSYPYTTAPTERDRMPGSTGRTPIVEVVLHLAGRGDADRLRASLDGFLEHWQFLEDRRRKTGTHVAPYGIAPYYFFYAHRYAAMAIEFLPEAERPPYRAKFLERLFQVQEPSGGWNDRVFDRSENFGTAMSLLALLEPGLSRPAGWR